MTRTLCTVLLCAAAATSSSTAWASSISSSGEAAVEQQGQRGTGRGAAQVSVAEAERVFDRYMLGQARMVLQLGPDQMVPFAQRFERLQELQRMRQRQRQRRLVELAALGRNGAMADDAAVAGVLQALDADMADADQRVLDARALVEDVLSVRQRARYRAFEARMEREKLQLITRARAEARGRGGRASEPAAPQTEDAPGSAAPR